MHLFPFLRSRLLSSRQGVRTELEIDTVSVCKCNAVRQVVVSRNWVRAVPSTVTSATLTSFVLNSPVSLETRRQQNLDLLHHKSLLQQPFSLTVVVCVIVRPWSDVDACPDVIGSGKSIPESARL